MNKREYIQANKDWLEAKSKEEGVRALPKGIYYKVLSEGRSAEGRLQGKNQSSATPTVRSIITAHYTGKTIDGKQFDSSIRNTLTEQETDILCAYYGLQTKRLSIKRIAEKHSLSESRVLRIVRESERKLQFSDEAISIWKYLYRK